MRQDIAEKTCVGMVIATHYMRMVVDPKLTCRHEGNRSLASAQIFTVLTYQQIFTIEEIAIDMINDPRCAIIWIAPRLPIDLLHRNTPTIKVLGYFTEGSERPSFTRHSQASLGFP